MMADVLRGLSQTMMSAARAQITCGCLIFQSVLSLIQHLGSLHFLVLLCAFFVLSVSAIDNEPIAIAQPSVARRHPSNDLLGICLFFGANVLLLSRNMLGPLMGITSILWVMMRNDSAINPKHSWMIFGVWSSLTLTYLSIQCHRVAYSRLYILLSMVLASSCLCVIALVQKSSLQGGIVTAIPPCTSFAAYAMAYFFPDSHELSYQHYEQSSRSIV